MHIRRTLAGLVTILSLAAPVAASAHGPSDAFLRKTSVSAVQAPIAYAKGRPVTVQRISRRLLRQSVTQNQKRIPVRYAVPLAREIL